MDVRLHLLDGVVDYADTLGYVLGHLSAGVKSLSANLDKVPEDLRDEVAEVDVEIIESLLGSAFVVCQAQITAVTKAALDIQKLARAEKIEFKAYGGQAHEVRALGERCDTNFSKVEVVWELGNYFKHREEWPQSAWVKPSPKLRHTIPVLLAAGLQPSSNGNLRAGSAALGNPDFDKMSVFFDIVNKWGVAVRDATYRALSKSPPERD